MTELPERIWCIASTARYGMWYDSAAPVHVEYLRADTAVTKAEAMVAAAYEAARNAAICAKSAYAAPTARIDIANAIDSLAKADARAAFEQAVREAVDAERERIVKIVASYVGCDNIVDAIRAQQETSE